MKLSRPWQAGWLLGSVTAAAAVAGDPQRDHEIVIDDYFTIGVMTDCAASPDGELLAYVEQRWDESEDARNADIWVVEQSTGRRRRLTFDPASDQSPVWSADGRWIYFTSARKRAGEDKPPHDGKQQVWRVGVDGMGLGPVTRVAGGIQDFALSRQGATLYYTTGKEQIEDEWKELRERYDELEYGHGVVTFGQLWKLDLESWRAEKIVDEKRVIKEFAVSPDEKRVAMLTTPTEELITNEGRSRVDVLDAISGTVESLPDRHWRDEAPTPYGWLESLAWSHDGRVLAFGVNFDGYPSEVFVARLDNEEVTIRRITRHNEISLMPETGLQWRGESADLLVRGEWRSTAPVYCVRNAAGDVQGETIDVAKGCIDCFDCFNDGSSLAVVMSGLAHPPDLFVVGLDAQADCRRVTNVNPQVDSWKLPRIELVGWASGDGTAVEGILELPRDYEGDRPLPMIVELHGGPTASSLLRMCFWIYGRVLMPARGYALLSPNYRGSTGYGDKFMTDLIGHENDREVADILAGVDAMVERGIADPERLGVMGWSNGGYLTNCLITKTTRFRAASSGAGVMDVVMQWSTEDTPGHVINFQGGFPWTNAAQMLSASPLFNADKIRAPTLIHVGEMDPRCPPGHSRALYRALHQYLGVPTELVVYPGAGHTLTSYKQRKAKMEWDSAWFDRYLLERPDEAGPAPGDRDA